jgi:uncharacterized protein (TIGR02246 family)
MIGTQLFLGSFAMAQPQAAPARAADRAAIERTLKNFLSAWNTHDAHAFALTFTPDADFTNVIGVQAHGRDNIETLHERVFATVFKHSHQTAQIRSIRFLTPRLADVDVDWQMTGATDRDGLPRREGSGRAKVESGPLQSVGSS